MTEYNPEHPIQPLVLVNGIVRFKANPIVRYLLDWASERGCNLNDLTIMSRAEGFTENDWEQFAQLIGYSHSGSGDLSYMSDEVWKAAYAQGKSAGVFDD